jgi:predicted neuraminidase
MKRLVASVLLAHSAAAQDPAVVAQEFIYETAPFPACHASTIAEPTGGGLVAAWFGGAKEGAKDVGIWVARQVDGKWSAPAEVATGEAPGEPRHPCWNPVLFQPAKGPLLLFYKVGPSPSKWWGMLRTSADGGATWSEARRLPEGILGPIKNKPMQLADGTILSPTSDETAGWRVHFERSADNGATWMATPPINDGKEIGAIQPSILRLPEGGLLALGRTKQGRLFETTSKDAGQTWSPMKLGQLPNPNSGTDAVTLRDGRHLIVYNHSAPLIGKWGGLRTPLNVAVSTDGHAWQSALVLEDEGMREFSYPAVIQTADGRVHITYTWRRERIKHVVVDPAKLVLKPLPEGP